MKIKRTHRILIAVLALALLCGTALAAGTIKTQMIEANYMGIRVVVDGLAVTPKDATGHEVEPFASSGTTYLPVRAVAEALGKDVAWDGETRTVYIGDNIPGKDINWMVKNPAYNLIHATAYEGTDEKTFFEAGGRKQTQGLVLECSGEYYGVWDAYPGSLKSDSKYTYNAAATWNNDEGYKTMHVTVVHQGDQTLNCTLEVWLDGVYSKTIQLPYDGPAKKLDISLNAAPSVTLKLLAQQEGVANDSIANLKSQTQYAFYDISFS